MKRITYLLVFFLLLTGAACTKPAETGENGGTDKKQTETAEKAIDGKAVFSTSEENKVLYEKDGIKVTYLKMTEDEYDYSLHLAYENQTDKEYDVQMRDDKLNGKESESIIISDDLPASTSVETEGIMVSKSALEKEAIEKPEKLEGDLVVLYSITEEAARIPISVTFE
ncbi:MAG: hypothetical protein Q4G11_01275 [Gallicola sp.]|nr:hypothetical protein [Gallicola sp.]